MSHRHAPTIGNDAPGMAGQRSRNDNGRLREKRGDTHAGTIEQQYHVDLASGATPISTPSSSVRVSSR